VVVMADTKYDDATRTFLARSSLPTSESAAPVKRIAAADLPSTAAGVPGLLVREMPYLKNTNVGGFILNKAPRGFFSGLAEDLEANYKAQPNVWLRPDANPYTLEHEIEHLLARQNTGNARSPNYLFDELISSNRSDAVHKRNKFLDALVEELPYLKEKYGIRNGYMTENFINGANSASEIEEILATLAGAETSLGVDLTKDPKLRKSVFKDRNLREAYNAVTGLRQTRLDAKDLKPYTRLEEPVEPGVMGKLKRLLGYANGGAVLNAGNKKLI
jgi:hypothetical protein